jgi:hypothetical protein
MGEGGAAIVGAMMEAKVESEKDFAGYYSWVGMMRVHSSVVRMNWTA